MAGCTGGSDGSGPVTDPGNPGGGPIINVTPPLPQARNLLPALNLSNANFESDHFSGSGTCAACHNDESMRVSTAVRGETRDVGIGKAWETSVMANATRDPYWHAVVASELHNYPMLDEFINDKCIRCHAPMASEYAKKEGVPLRLFDSGSEAGGDLIKGLLSLESGDPLYDHGMDGVSCTLCHQIDAGNLGTEQSMTGGFEIVDYRGLEIDERPAYGQYGNPDGAYMQEQVNFLAMEGAHVSTSESCATCHNLNVDAVDTEGNPVGGDHFAEQAMYSEWLNSDFRTGGLQEASCQSCHMPVIDEAIKIAAGSTNGVRDNFAEHSFLGANTVMQDMLKNFSEELGVPAGLDFDTSIARNREFLTTSASIEVRDLNLSGTTLDFDINVLNKAGHKLPSGYHSRRVYLHVEVIDAEGEQVFESGRIRADGSIIGVSEDINPASWELHYDRITSPAQVQVYQAIVGNSDGDRTHSLVNGDRYLKDNRLTPQGFDKVAVNADPNLPASFGIFGAAVEDDDFNQGRDTVSYSVAIPEAGEFTVRAELRYQPLSFGHLRQLFTESEEVDQVDMFRTIYEATTLRDEIIATSTASTTP